jgi:hypothetical protein
VLTTTLAGGTIPLDQITVDEEGHQYNDQICWETMIGQVCSSAFFA